MGGGTCRRRGRRRRPCPAGRTRASGEARLWPAAERRAHRHTPLLSHSPTSTRTSRRLARPKETTGSFSVRPPRARGGGWRAPFDARDAMGCGGGAPDAVGGRMATEAAPGVAARPRREWRRVGHTPRHGPLRRPGRFDRGPLQCPDSDGHQGRGAGVEGRGRAGRAASDRADPHPFSSPSPRPACSSAASASPSATLWRPWWRRRGRP